MALDGNMHGRDCLKVECIFVPVLNLDMVKIDWACNPCTKTATIRSNSNKQSSLETCKAQGAYKIELLLHIDISPWGVYDWLSFWYFLARASIHICVDLLWIFWFGFPFCICFYACVRLASPLLDLLLAMLLPNMLPSSWRVNSALAHLSEVWKGWWLWFLKH